MIVHNQKPKRKPLPCTHGKRLKKKHRNTHFCVRIICLNFAEHQLCLQKNQPFSVPNSNNSIFVANGANMKLIYGETAQCTTR